MRNVYLTRHYDKCCFGKYRAVQATSLKPYYIKQGKVCIKFRGKYHEIAEESETTTDRYLQFLIDNNCNTGLSTASVIIADFTPLSFK